MRLKACCMMVLFMITTISYSQHQTYPHTLLWRISGKGLTHPSYLFGIINKSNPVSTGSYTFTDSVMGISFVSPIHLTLNSQLSSDREEAWHVSTFTGTDLVNGSFVMLL